MSQAQTSTGSTTSPAAVPATTQAPAPHVAAPAATPAPNVPVAPVPKPGKNYTPRKGMDGAIVAGSGLSQMLSAVAEVYFSNDPNLRVPNYVVPNFIVFFQVLGMMDTQMAHTKRFTDANPDWLPFVSQLYYSILALYFVLKCQEVGNQISQEQRLFLEYLENNFNIAHAKIAGPLVPFFQSLAACSGPDSRYGNVTFGIPSNLHVTQAQHFLAANRINAHLPSIIVILDQMMRYIQRFMPAGAAPAAFTNAITDSFYLDIFGTAAAAAAANAVCMKTPNARVNINVPFSVCQGFLQSTDIWRNTLPFDPATNQSTYLAGANAAPLEFDQILGFRGYGATAGTSFPWFAEVGRIMQPYADFFRDSVSLGAVATTGIGVIYVETRILNSATNVTALTAAVATRNVRYQAAGTLRYDIPSVIDLEFTHFVREEELDLVAQQMGVLTAYNTLWDVNLAAGSVWPGPLTGNIRVGTVWNRPQTVVTRQTQPLRFVGNLISGYFHVPVAGKFGN